MVVFLHVLSFNICWSLSELKKKMKKSDESCLSNVTDVCASVIIWWVWWELPSNVIKSWLKIFARLFDIFSFSLPINIWICMGAFSALWLLMSWCFSTRASVTTVHCIRPVSQRNITLNQHYNIKPTLKNKIKFWKNIQLFKGYMLLFILCKYDTTNDLVVLEIKCQSACYGMCENVGKVSPIDPWSHQSFLCLMATHHYLSQYWLNFNTLKLRQNGHHFACSISKLVFFDVGVWVSEKISLKFVPKGLNNWNSTLKMIYYSKLHYIQQ